EHDRRASPERRGRDQQGDDEQVAAAERAEERRDEAAQEVILGARVVDEVLRQPAGAVVVVAEMVAEVVDDGARSPPADRDRVDVDEPDRGDGGRGAEQRPRQPTQVLAAEPQRAAEEVRTDRDEIVPRTEQDGVPAGSAAECILRDQRVDDDERGEGERERVHDPEVERQLSLPPRLDRNADERDAEQDLLPRRDDGQRGAAQAGSVERGHRRVVHREPDDEQVERHHRPPPDCRRRTAEEQRVERERSDRPHREEGNGAGGETPASPPLQSARLSAGPTGRPPSPSRSRRRRRGSASTADNGSWPQLPPKGRRLDGGHFRAQWGPQGSPPITRATVIATTRIVASSR